MGKHEIGSEVFGSRNGEIVRGVVVDSQGCGPAIHWDGMTPAEFNFNFGIARDSREEVEREIAEEHARREEIARQKEAKKAAADARRQRWNALSETERSEIIERREAACEHKWEWLSHEEIRCTRCGRVEFRIDE